GATRKLGHGHPQTQRFVAGLADLYGRWGRPEEAQPLLRQQLDRLLATSGAESAAAGAMAELGLNLLQQKKHAEAEKVLGDSLRIREKAQPEEGTTFNTKSLLGEALLGQKKHAEAEPPLVQGYEGMKAREAKVPPAGKVRLREALERLVRLYEATGDKEQAARWRGKLEEAEKAAKEAPKAPKK